ncbi:hypothetical protein BU17DRAFT_49951 [Hysterangium stoloniferum]|nr:hypothetical protein BU17DRAFT_49951 [Hysterangium stoloniferum]
MFTLPIISIAPYLSPAVDDAARRLRRETSAALHDACLKYGFFYLDISAYVDTSETDELVRLAREFFALPQVEKDLLSLKNEDNARGYARLYENVTSGKADNHEGLDFYRPVDVPDKSKPLWGTNQWPTVPGFREKYEIWVEKMRALGLIVMEAMAVGLGMASGEWEDLRSKVDESFWIMRVIGYPPLPEDHDGISCGAHKDYGCLTFLYADPTPSALQVYLHKKPPTPLTGAVPGPPDVIGGTWIDADPIPGCVVCNIGEMWELWTAGLYRSTLHRVIHRGSNYRIPFFFEPNFNARIEPLNAAHRLIKLGDEANDAVEVQGAVPRKKYKSVVYGESLLKKVGSNFSGGGKYNQGNEL